jgi:hypothetical protein
VRYVNEDVITRIRGNCIIVWDFFLMLSLSLCAKFEGKTRCRSSAHLHKVEIIISLYYYFVVAMNRGCMQQVVPIRNEHLHYPLKIQHFKIILHSVLFSNVEIKRTTM